MTDNHNNQGNHQTQTQSQTQNQEHSQAPAQNSAQNQPESVLRDGNIKASIWRNEGDSGAFRSTTFARTYEDRDGNLRDTHSFAGTDLLKVAELARGAYARSNELRRAEFMEQRRGDGSSERGRKPEPSRTR